MFSKRLSIYGLISAAALVSGALVGCGGSSASVAGSSPIVQTKGGFTTSPGTGPASTSAGSSPQQVQVTLSNGTTTTATLPANTTTPPNGVVATIAPGITILQGLTLAPKFHGRTNPLVSGAQGSVYVNGVDTGLTISSTGQLSGYLVLPPGFNGTINTPATYQITAYGPYNITDSTGTKTLTVGQFNFQVVVVPTGDASIPGALVMQLPTNGGSLEGGNFVQVYYGTALAGGGVTTDHSFDGGTASLQISTSISTVSDSDLVAAGFLEFNRLSPNPATDGIPASGVNSVTFSYSLPATRVKTK